MGIYNEYYQKYYSSIKRQGSAKAYTPQRHNEANGTRYNKYTSNNSKMGFPIYLNVMGKGFANIFIVQSLVVAVFIGGILIGRKYPGGYVASACDKGISYINNGILGEKNVTMENLANTFTVKNLAETFTVDNATQVFNEIKSFITMEEKKEGYIMANYKLPVDVNKNNGISVVVNRLLIKLPDESDVKASYSGKVKSITSGDKITVIIDYGDGIEMKYEGLREVSVIEGGDVKANDIIGKSLNEADHGLSIEVLYMGSMLNPTKCFDFERVK